MSDSIEKRVKQTFIRMTLPPEAYDKNEPTKLVDGTSLDVLVSKIENDTDLFANPNINSLFMMRLVVAIEEEFGFEIPDENLDLDLFRTVNKIVSLIEENIAEVDKT